MLFVGLFRDRRYRGRIHHLDERIQRGAGLFAIIRLDFVDTLLQQPPNRGADDAIGHQPLFDPANCTIACYAH